MTDPQLRTCVVYEGPGEAHVLSMEIEAVGETLRRPTIADRVALRAIMTRKVICARPDLDVASIVKLVIHDHLGCIPVVDERQRPIGVITKYDLVEQLDATLQAMACNKPLPAELAAQTANDLMMPLAITLNERASIAHAAMMMTLEDLHHVLVISETGTLVGVVSSKDIVRWIVENDRLDEPVTYDAEW